MFPCLSLRRACRHPEVLSIRALADNGQKTLHAIITYDERMRTTGSARLECSDLIQCFVLARMVRKKNIDSRFRGDVLKTPGRRAVGFESVRRPLKIEAHTAPHAGKVPLVSVFDRDQ